MRTSAEPWWGITAASTQAEGVAAAADWSPWIRSGRWPDSGDGNGFVTNYPDDLAILADLGLTHVRLTLEWSRIEPAAGKVDNDALDRYDDILVAAGRAGLQVLATLAHGALPGWFADDEGGFAEALARERFWAPHVDRMAERFGDLVSGWVPIDDPIGWAVRGLGLGSRPPGRRSIEAMLTAAEGALFALLRADELLGSGPLPVIGSFGVPTVFGTGPDAEAEARWWRQLLFHSWLGLVRDGELVLPDRPPLVLDDAAGALDLIGVSHDHPIGVDREGALQPYPDGARRSDTGFSPVPNELAELIAQLHAELPGRSLLVTGHGVATADDEWREELLKAAVAIVAEARTDGVPLVGYLHDTGIDGWEGPFGFNTQRGLIARDRSLKDSGAWLRGYLRP